MVTSERERAARLVRAHGRDATAFQTLTDGFLYYLERDAVVAYVDVPRGRVAAGAPIAPPERIDAVADAFVADARSAGRRATFFGVGGPLGALALTPIGEEPVWDPRTWAATLRGAPSLREQLRRARAKGVRVRALAPRDAERVPELVARWESARPMPPMGFLVGVDPFGLPGERRVLLAERDGELAGLACTVPIPARSGALLETLVRDPKAPNGTSELLVDGVMRDALAQGRTLVSLGLAPLSGDLPAALRVARALGAPLYDFDGLRRFKSKLRPSAWEPRFLAREPRTTAVTAFRDVLTAFAHRPLLDFGLETLRRA